jgi:iron complex outermembrane receptor protein
MSNVSSINVGRTFSLEQLALVSLPDSAPGSRVAEAALVRIEQPIVVTTPSLIRRRPARPAAPPHRAGAGTHAARGCAAPPPEPVVARAAAGTLPIVTDQFATVTVVTNEELNAPHRRGTLGDAVPEAGIGRRSPPRRADRAWPDVNRVGIAENGTAPTALRPGDHRPVNP